MCGLCISYLKDANSSMTHEFSFDSNLVLGIASCGHFGDHMSDNEVGSLSSSSQYVI